MRILLLCLLACGAPLLAADAPLRAIDPDDATGSAAAVVVDDVPIAQTTQLLPRGELAPAGQVESVFDELAGALRLARSGIDKIVRLNVYAANDEVIPLIHKGLAKRFPGKHKPAVTIVVGTPVKKGVVVSLDAVAVSGLAGGRGTGSKVFPPGHAAGREAPVAILAPGMVFYIAGQAERGKSLAESTRKTLASLDGTLTFLGCTRGEVAQVKAFVHPMKEIANVRKEIAAYFADLPIPPVTLVEWTATDSIEIEIVVANPHTRGKRSGAIDFLTPPGMKASPIYSRVSRINRGKRLYTSGITEVEKDGQAEVKAVFARLAGVLKKGGSDFGHLAKATYYVSTEEASKQLNVLRPDYYDPKRPPSASKAPVRGVGRKGSGLVLDMIAVVP
jgi:enamine deaminase RidA (YjgF/YER057c/UK114 family)